VSKATPARTPAHLGLFYAVRYRRNVPTIDTLVLRRAGVATLLVGVVGTIIGTIVAGTQGLIAGVFGTVLVLVFFSVGQIALGAVLKNNPQNAMLVAMTLYLVKIGVLLVLLLVLQDATFFAPKVFAAVIVSCTLAWTFVEVWVFSRTKVLYVDPEVRK
jgi:ATP synthase protein I